MVCSRASLAGIAAFVLSLEVESVRTGVEDTIESEDAAILSGATFTGNANREATNKAGTWTLTSSDAAITSEATDTSGTRIETSSDDTNTIADETEGATKALTSSADSIINTGRAQGSSDNEGKREPDLTVDDIVRNTGSVKNNDATNPVGASYNSLRRTVGSFMNEALGVADEAGRIVSGFQPDMGVIAADNEDQVFEATKCKLKAFKKAFLKVADRQSGRCGSVRSNPTCCIQFDKSDINVFGGLYNKVMFYGQPMDFWQQNWVLYDKDLKKDVTYQQFKQGHSERAGWAGWSRPESAWLAQWIAMYNTNVDSEHPYKTVGSCTEVGEAVRKMYKHIFKGRHQDPCSFCETCQNKTLKSKTAILDCKKCLQKGHEEWSAGVVGQAKKVVTTLGLLLPRGWRDRGYAPCYSLMKFIMYLPIYIDLRSFLGPSLLERLDYSQWKLQWQNSHGLNRVVNWLIKYSGKLDEKVKAGGISADDLNNIIEKQETRAWSEWNKTRQVVIEQANADDDQNQAIIKPDVAQKAIDALKKVMKIDLTPLTQHCEAEVRSKSESIIKKLNERVRDPCVDRGLEERSEMEATMTEEELAANRSAWTWGPSWTPRRRSPTCQATAAAARTAYRTMTMGYSQWNDKKPCVDGVRRGKTACPPGTRCSCQSVMDTKHMTGMNLFIFALGNAICYTIGIIGLIMSGAGIAAGAAIAAGSAAFPDTIVEVAAMVLYGGIYAAQRVQCGCALLPCMTYKAYYKPGQGRSRLRDDLGSEYSVHCYIAGKDLPDEGINVGRRRRSVFTDFKKGQAPFVGLQCAYESQSNGIFSDLSFSARSAYRTVTGSEKLTAEGECKYSFAQCGDTDLEGNLEEGTGAPQGWFERESNKLNRQPQGTDVQKCFPEKLNAATLDKTIGKVETHVQVNTAWLAKWRTNENALAGGDR